MRICTCHLWVDAGVTAKAKRDEVGQGNPFLWQGGHLTGHLGGMNMTFVLLQKV